jgi:hypothetical protein
MDAETSICTGQLAFGTVAKPNQINILCKEELNHHP